MKNLFLAIALLLFTANLAVAAPYGYKEEYNNYDDDYNSTDENDSLEPINRAIYEFNYVVDGVLLDPLARGYNQVMPEWGKKRISNFAYNVTEPVTMINSVLQGDDINAFTSLWRFIINTTFGLLGTFDAAAEIGLEPRPEGFGQTLYTWGVTDTPYLVLPILGPSTVSNLVGMGADYASNPFNYSSVLDREEVLIHTWARIIDTKSKAVVITDEIKKTALDPYTATRSMYLQNFIKRAENKN